VADARIGGAAAEENRCRGLSLRCARGREGRGRGGEVRGAVRSRLILMIRPGDVPRRCRRRRGDALSSNKSLSVSVCHWIRRSGPGRSASGARRAAV